MPEERGTEQRAQPGQPLEPTERFRTVVAMLIVIASLMGSAVALSASVASRHASDYDHYAIEQFALKEQILTLRRGQVAEEVRLAATYQDHVLASTSLARQADRARERDPVVASALDQEAQAESALARTTGAYFRANFPTVAESGRVSYDQRQALANLLSQDIQYQGLDPDAMQARARDTHARADRLVGVGIVFVVALFFLTMAQIIRALPRLPFAVAGTIVMLAGAILWAVVGLT